MVFIKMLVISTFLITCAIIAYTDIQKQTIYNEAVAVLLVPAIVSFFVFPEIGVASRLLGAASVSGMMLLMSLLIPGAFGGGDIKLMVPVGLFLGFQRTLLAGMLAVLSGGLWAIVVLVRRYFRRHAIDTACGMKFPFGPVLCIGSMAALLAGEKVLDKVL